MSDGIVWTGQVNFTDSSDVGVTGVATLTLTPSVGVTNLPALVQGDPGPSPTFRNITVNQVAAGTTPPASTWTLVTPASVGVGPVYDLTLYVNSGADGISGTFTLSSATDLSGALTDKYMLVYDAPSSKWTVVAQRVPFLIVPSAFASYAGNGTQATLAGLTVPAQQFNWRPVVLNGYACPTGTANTNIDLVVMLTDPTTGSQIGYGPGTPGATPPVVYLGSPYGGAITGTFALVPAGQAASIYFVARQTNNLTSDAWAVPNTANRISLTLLGVPLP